MLKAWCKDHFGNVVQKIKRTKELLWKAQVDSARIGCSNEMERLKGELNNLYDKEENMWQQRSLLQWLRSGDQNEVFPWYCYLEKMTEFSGILNKFFAELFTSSNPHDLDQILDDVQEVVTEEMRADLARPQTVEEVDYAIKEMASLKALRPDGMPPLFYQTYWIDEVWMSLGLCYYA